jgi:hypothetical protein
MPPDPPIPANPKKRDRRLMLAIGAGAVLAL